MFYSSSDLVSDSLPRHSYLESHLVRPVFCLNVSYNGREADRRHVSTFLGLYAMLPPHVAHLHPPLTPHSFILDRLVQRYQRRQRSCVNSLILLSKSIRHLPQTHFTFFPYALSLHAFLRKKYRWSTQTSNARHCSRFALHLGNCDRNIRYCCCGHRKSQIPIPPFPYPTTCYLLPVVRHLSSSPRLEPIPNSQSPLTR